MLCTEVREISFTDVCGVNDAAIGKGDGDAVAIGLYIKERGVHGQKNVRCIRCQQLLAMLVEAGRNLS
jgi:hypothetical protein